MPRYKVTTLLDDKAVDWYVIAASEEHAKSKAVSDSVFSMTVLPLIGEEFFEGNMSPFDAMTVLEVQRFPEVYNVVPDWIWKLG